MNSGFLDTSHHSCIDVRRRVTVRIKGLGQSGYERLFHCKHACKRPDFCGKSVISRSFVPAVLAIRTLVKDDFCWIGKWNGFTFCRCEIFGTVFVEGVSSTLRNLAWIKVQIFEFSCYYT